METLFQEKNRNEVLSRLQALSADSERRWGRMTVHQMLCHAADQLRMSLGEIETEPRRNIMDGYPQIYIETLQDRGISPTVQKKMVTRFAVSKGDLYEHQSLAVSFRAAGVGGTFI